MNTTLTRDTVEVPDNYYGHDLDRMTCEALAIQRIPVRLLKHELAASHSRWFDYHLLHPTKATYLFAAAYSLSFRRTNMIRKDYMKGWHMKGFKGADFMDSREMIGFWKGRLMADRLGLPYDFYTGFAIQWCRSRIWNHLPRPTQLYQRDMLVAMAERWRDLNRADIQVPRSERFLIETQGEAPLAPDQLAFRAWLIKRIADKTRPEAALAHYLYIEPRIVEAEAEAALGSDMVRRAGDFYRLLT